MRVYIAGKMRGVKDFNKYAFNDAENYLIELGFDAVNPVAIDESNGIVLVSETGDIADIEGFTLNDLKDVIRRDVEAVIGCDAVYMLNGWETSKGARAERAIALWLGLVVMYQGDDGSWRV